MKRALLLVDATPTFMPGGELPVPDGDAIIGPILRLIREGAYDEVGDIHEEHPAGHISFASRHGARPYTTIKIGGKDTLVWPDHALAGSANARLHPALSGEWITFRFLKGLRADAECYGSFAYADGEPTGLADELKRRGVTDLTLAGLATDYCVGETALQAMALGYSVTVAKDACRGVAPDTTAVMLARLKRAGVRLA